MEKYERILILNNDYEADLLGEVLTDRKIPHGIIASDDSVLEGINQMEFGWGYVEAPENYRKIIQSLYDEIIKK